MFAHTSPYSYKIHDHYSRSSNESAGTMSLCIRRNTYIVQLPGHTHPGLNTLIKTKWYEMFHQHLVAQTMQCARDRLARYNLVNDSERRQQRLPIRGNTGRYLNFRRIDHVHCSNLNLSSRLDRGLSKGSGLASSK